MVEAKQEEFAPKRLYNAEGHVEVADSQEVYDWLLGKGYAEQRPGGPAGFQATWLYHKNGGSELVETEAVYQALMEKGEWASSPADHGVITAPSRDQMQLMGQPASGQLVSAEGGAMPSSVEARMSSISSEVSGLFDTMHSQQQALDGVQDLLKQILRRLDAMEHEPVPPSVTAAQATSGQAAAQTPPTAGRK